jgi:hypothetical protein
MSYLSASQASSAPNAFAQIRSTPSSFIKQVNDALASDIHGFVSASELPQISWRGKRYVLEQHLHRNKSKGRRSWIKDHGFFLLELVGDETKAAYWACQACSLRNNPQFYNVQSTAAPLEHLRKVHRLQEAGSDADADADGVLGLQRAAAAKRPAGSSITKAQATLIYELAVGFIVNSNLPFSIFEDPYLNSLLAKFDVRIRKEVSLGRNTVTSSLEMVYGQAQKLVKQQLAQATTAIHISFDAWTSPNQLAMIAIVAHFLDEKYEYQTRLLALRRHLGDYSGPNIATTLEYVLWQWAIESKIGVAVCDNATNNDTCLRHLFPHLNQWIRLEDVKYRRICCFGYILNLVTKAFLFRDNTNVFKFKDS